MQRDLARFRAVWHSSAADYDHTGHLVTSDADLPWISGGGEKEWLTIDLGAASRLTGVTVLFGAQAPRRGSVLLSEDGDHWEQGAAFAGAPDGTVEAPLTGTARYLRLVCEDSTEERFVVRKVSVWGENELCYALPPLPAPEEDRQALTGGNWRICRAEQVEGDGERLSAPGYDDSGWLPAAVPGTALVSYLNAGAIPDPDYDDDQFQISEAYFTADFWYRDRFEVPADRQGRRVLLCFDAINWKADVWLNGTFLKNALPHREHSLEGAFIRGEFDVTELVRFGAENCLAVRIYKNDTPGEVTTQGLAWGPGPNGGALGADNPTLHAAVGWDWLPTIRGRDIGIYGDVCLRFAGDVALADPWVETRLDLLEESSANPAEDLMRTHGVTVTGLPERMDDWRGKEGDAFTVDFGAPRTLGSVTFLWGTEAVGGAADLESRQPEQFKVEVSDDGESWRNFDAYPGGEVDMRWFGTMPAEARPGSDFFEGHSISDSVQGGTAVLSIDLSRFGAGIREFKMFSPGQARYLRFTVVKRREINGRPVDTRLNALRVYEQSPEQVEQGMTHTYTLDTSKAGLVYRGVLRNRSDQPVTVTLRGRILPEGPAFTRTVELGAKAAAPVEVDLTLTDPRLWWPNTYGKQFLYTAEAEVLVEGAISEHKRFSFGVRRFDTPIDGGLMTLYCNGTRILCKGGNWGLDDGLKRDTARVLDDKVRLHAQENMTMIRNWVGMTGHPGFYEACDKYGILIWDDFWLANPFDGPEPNDPDMFLENAADKIRAVRRHPALALYCGRNEGNPNEILNPALERLTKELDGTRLYVPHSAAAPVGSGGGYSLAAPGGSKGVKQYFNDVSSTVIRSERGVPNVPALESIRRFLRPENRWPISESWALHDWTYHSNGPAGTYMAAVQTYLGGEFPIPEDHVEGAAPREDDPVYQQFKADVDRMCRQAAEAWTLEEFSRAAQLINYDNHRGMFDGLAARRANGLLMWMSQASWPSFMWQTYDFYLDVNGGYFGAKAGNQPTRPVFDPRDDSILLANATPRRYERVKTVLEVFDLAGALASRQEVVTDVLEADAYGEVIATADFSPAATDVVFLRLTLTDEDGNVLGRNLYWHNRKVYQDYRALASMAPAQVSCTVTEKDRENGERRFLLRVENGPVPALGVRIRLTDETGAPVLPVFYEDNYLMLMPGEVRELTAAVAADRLPGAPVWSLSGWNLEG